MGGASVLYGTAGAGLGIADGMGIGGGIFEGFDKSLGVVKSQTWA
jgi:hypothetical protein